MYPHLDYMYYSEELTLKIPRACWAEIRALVAGRRDAKPLYRNTMADYAMLVHPRPMCPRPKILGCCIPWTNCPFAILPLTEPSHPFDWIERSDTRLLTAARFSAAKRWSSMCGPSVHPTEGRQSINLVRGVGQAGQTPHWFIRRQRPTEAAIAADGASSMLDAAQGRETSVKDTISKGRFVQGAQHPRIFRRGHIGRGHLNPASEMGGRGWGWRQGVWVTGEHILELIRIMYHFQNHVSTPQELGGGIFGFSLLNS